MVRQLLEYEEKYWENRKDTAPSYQMFTEYKKSSIQSQVKASETSNFII